MKMKSADVRVRDFCLSEGHVCDTCKERVRQISRFGGVKRLIPVIGRYMEKYPDATVKEMSNIFGFPDVVIEDCIRRTSKPEKKKGMK